MEETVDRNRKAKMMTRLRLWASDNGIELYGTIKEAREGITGYMQNGSTRQGTKLYGVNDYRIYVWCGKDKGWVEANKPVVLKKNKKVKNNLPIEMYEDGEHVATFNSVSDCSNKTGIPYTTIYSNIRGFSKDVYGTYTFKRGKN